MGGATQRSCHLLANGAQRNWQTEFTGKLFLNFKQTRNKWLRDRTIPTPITTFPPAVEVDIGRLKGRIINRIQPYVQFFWNKCPAKVPGRSAGPWKGSWKGFPETVPGKGCWKRVPGKGFLEKGSWKGDSRKGFLEMFPGKRIPGKVHVRNEIDKTPMNINED